MFVPAGTRLTWIGQFDGNDFIWKGIATRVQDVAATLKNSYYIDIESSSDNYGLIYSSSFNITLHLLTNMDRGNGSDGLGDIKGNVRDAFINDGATPTGNAISSYTLPNSSPHNIPGAPVAPAPGVFTPKPDPGSDTPGVPKQCSLWQRLTGDTSQCLVKADQFTWDKLGTATTAFVVGGIAVVGLIIFLTMREAV
jgi:hypothetical protein